MDDEWTHSVTTYPVESPTLVLDTARLIRAVESTAMGMFWRDEPAQKHDPPNMRRVKFLHREYAEALARAYLEGSAHEL